MASSAMLTRRGPPGSERITSGCELDKSGETGTRMFSSFCFTNCMTSSRRNKRETYMIENLETVFILPVAITVMLAPKIIFLERSDALEISN